MHLASLNEVIFRQSHACNSVATIWRNKRPLCQREIVTSVLHRRNNPTFFLARPDYSTSELDLKKPSGPVGYENIIFRLGLFNDVSAVYGLSQSFWILLKNKFIVFYDSWSDCVSRSRAIRRAFTVIGKWVKALSHYVHFSSPGAIFIFSCLPFSSWVTSHRPWFTQTETCTEYLRHTYMPSARSGAVDVFISWLWFFCVVILPGGYGCCFSFSIHYYHQPEFSSLSVSF